MGFVISVPLRDKGWGIILTPLKLSQLSRYFTFPIDRQDIKCLVNLKICTSYVYVLCLYVYLTVKQPITSLH